MGAASWKNPYVDLVETKSDYLLACKNGEVSANELDLLKQRITQYEDLICEPCSGSGGHLLEQAQAAPATLFVGFELRYKRSFRTVEKAERAGINNILVVRNDARVMNQLFEPSSLGGVYVNFPDPWAKHRWTKHRLLNLEFLTLVFDLLRNGGFFSYKTDHPEYFRSTVDYLDRLPRARIETATDNLARGSGENSNITTEFERLFRSQQQPVHYLYAIKVGV